MNYAAKLPSDSNSPSEAAEKPLPSRQLARFIRDRDRGYSINTKQIVLAFAVEFTIIGLILTNIYVTIAQLPDPSAFKITQAMLFPVAMAMVELARVPLAVAVRTQNSWIVKLAALLGVLCAVAVTSNSLYAIGATSFTPRLEDSHKKNDALLIVQDERSRKQNEINETDANKAQRQKDLDVQDRALQALNEQLTKQPMQTCGQVSIPNPLPGAPPTMTQRCTPNPAFKILTAEIAAAKQKVEQARNSVTQAEAQLQSKREEMRPIDQSLSTATSDNRETVFQSQLHSLAAMLFRVDPDKVTAAQLKTLEFYLVFISSIAAAFSSTLIAMTAVRRITPPPPAKSISIPDEAVAYLFGPLIAALRKEAADAVAAAVNGVTTKAPETKGT